MLTRGAAVKAATRVADEEAVMGVETAGPALARAAAETAARRVADEEVMMGVEMAVPALGVKWVDLRALMGMEAKGSN